MDKKRSFNHSYQIKKSGSVDSLNEHCNKKHEHSETFDYSRQMNRSMVRTSNTAGKMFQHPFNSLFESMKIHEINHSNHKEDDLIQPYYKFVKVRKIYYRGKEIYELKLIQYCFLNQNLPLFNALPCQYILSQSMQAENQLKQYDSSSSDDEREELRNFDSDAAKMIAYGRKRRLIIKRKPKHHAREDIRPKINFRKNIRRLVKVLRKVVIKRIAEPFERLYENCRTRTFREGRIRSFTNISLSIMPDSLNMIKNISDALSLSDSSNKSSARKKKIDLASFSKKLQRSSEIILNVISRVNLSRKKIIWDVLEEIRFSKISIRDQKIIDPLDQIDSYSPESNSKSEEGKLSLINSKTEPSTEIEHQAIDKSDLDYYYLERLERMRDMGVREEDYSLIEQEEKYSIEQDCSSEGDLGYDSDKESEYSDSYTRSHPSETKIRKTVNTGSKNLGNGQYAEYEEEEQVYYCSQGDLERTLRRHPNSIKTYDDLGNSSVLTMELKSLLRECNEYSKASEVSSELCLSKCISESIESARHGEIPLVNRYMNEDIEIMSKEIEHIRDQILNSSPIEAQLLEDSHEFSSGTKKKRKSFGKVNKIKYALV